jgi:hypothetical protein
MMNSGADAIRERAYQIWEHEGRPHGKDFEHWLQAERELAAPKKATKRTRTSKSADSSAAKRTTGSSPRSKRAH